jgi:glucose-1-phosphate thymidylyltransferase
MAFQCIIPAGGFAVRLGEIATKLPKGLLPMGDQTVMDHIYARLCELPSLGEICIVTNDKFYNHYVEWAKSVSNKKIIKVISDGGTDAKNARGANYGVWYGIEKMGWQKEDILIMGSDNFMPESLLPLSKLFDRGNDSIVAICDYGSKETAKRLVVPELSNDGTVLSIQEKPLEPKTTLGCPLIYFVKSKEIHYLKELVNKGKKNLGYLLELIHSNDTLKGYLFKKPIIDIGKIEDYNLAQKMTKNS